jgi:hypothetical protein
MRPVAHRRSIHPLAVGGRQVQRLRGESRVRGGTASGGTWELVGRTRRGRHTRDVVLNRRTAEGREHRRGNRQDGGR